MAQGEKKYSHQSRHGGWQMLGKTCRETCGPFILVSGRFRFMCTRDRNPSSSERREQAGGPSKSRSCFPWWRRGQGKELLQVPSSPTHPLWMAGNSVAWWEADVAKGISLQRLSYSGQTAGRLSCGRVSCLRKPPQRRDAPGEGILCQGSLLHWHW